MLKVDEVDVHWRLSSLVLRRELRARRLRLADQTMLFNLLLLERRVQSVGPIFRLNAQSAQGQFRRGHRRRLRDSLRLVVLHVRTFLRHRVYHDFRGLNLSLLPCGCGWTLPLRAGLRRDFCAVSSLLTLHSCFISATLRSRIDRIKYNSHVAAGSAHN